ncbi:putative multiple epidermal growth factor-like domains protein 10, partial [Apostichopus japonicus]
SGLVPLSEVYIPHHETVCCPGSYQDAKGHCESPCPIGRYGQDCLLNCSCVNALGTCNSEDGSCDCNEGWTGRDCDKRCPPGYYGKNCRESTLSCMNGGTNDPFTGICLCPVTHQGIHCEEACTSQSCTVDCHRCSKSATLVCDAEITVCRCKAGWQGYYCTEPCETGFKGAYCSDECCSKNGIHIAESDTCKCNDGYHGDDCEEKCEAGKYGPNCGLTCDCDDCDHVTGACVECPAGFTGERCTNPCPAKSWGLTCNRTCTCYPGEECDVFSGNCKKRAKVAKQESPDSDLDNTSNMTLALVAGGGAALMLLIALVLLISTKCSARKRNHEMEEVSVKPDNKAIITHSIDYGKEDTNSVYQEIDEYPYRYTKPDLPSAPPGIQTVNQSTRECLQTMTQITWSLTSSKKN